MQIKRRNATEVFVARGDDKYGLKLLIACKVG